MKHTQEPWKLHDSYNKIAPLSVPNKKSPDYIHYGLTIARGNTIIGDVSGVKLLKPAPIGYPRVESAEEVEANANRIIACVNGCAGIPNPAAIPEVVEALKGCLVAMDELAAQHGHTENPHMSCRIARTALAKLEGGEG